MIPKLYSSNNSLGTSLTGYGYIDHTNRCICREVLNGEYVLELETDINDRNAARLLPQMIISAQPNPTDNEQRFVIYKTERTIKNRITAYAEHIHTLCNNFVVGSSGAYTAIDNIVIQATPLEVWEYLLNNEIFGDVVPRFNFSSNITTKARYYLGLSQPETLGNIFGGVEGSFRDLWGGDFKYDNFNISFVSRRGTDSGFTLAYGKNISDGKQTADSSSLYTHILPYGEAHDVNNNASIYLVGNLLAIANSEGTLRRVIKVDCSAKTKDLKVYTHNMDGHTAGEGYAEVKAALATAAAKYAKSNGLAAQSVNVAVTHRSDLDNMTSIALGDTVSVLLSNLGTTAQARITSAEYDVLNERWDKLQIGSTKVTLSSVLRNQSLYL